ncbi:MAG: DUF1573 domain-containing protein [Rufibacter sp.]
MRVLLVTSILLFFCSAATKAQTTPSATAVTVVTTPKDSASVVVGPSILFEEQKFDFGKIKQGEVVEHTFRFTNNGSQPLIISNVRTTCGCTATDYPKAPVPPGETASITAKFNSAGKRGPQNKVITVDSNAVQGTTQVMIVTNIEVPGQ